MYLGRAKSKNVPRGRDVRYELEEPLPTVSSWVVSTVYGHGLSLFSEFVGCLDCWLTLSFLGFFPPLLPWVWLSLYTAGVHREHPLFWHIFIWFLLFVYQKKKKKNIDKLYWILAPEIVSLVFALAMLGSVGLYDTLFDLIYKKHPFASLVSRSANNLVYQSNSSVSSYSISCWKSWISYMYIYIYIYDLFLYILRIYTLSSLFCIWRILMSYLSSLSSLPIYFMLLFSIPKVVRMRFGKIKQTSSREVVGHWRKKFI